MIVSKNTNARTAITIYNERIEQVDKIQISRMLDNKGLESRNRNRLPHRKRKKHVHQNEKFTIKIHTVFKHQIPFLEGLYTILLYGVESWMLGVYSMWRLEALEMWVMQIMLRISWVEHISNETVLVTINVGRKIPGIVKK